MNPPHSTQKPQAQSLRSTLLHCYQSIHEQELSYQDHARAGNIKSAPNFSLTKVLKLVQERETVDLLTLLKQCSQNRIQFVSIISYYWVSFTNNHMYYSYLYTQENLS